jgi:hypothetical protein
MEKLNKDTSKIVEELNLCDEFRTFYDENKEYMIDKSLADLLNSYIKAKNLHKSDIIHNSGLSEVYTYQIFFYCLFKALST